MKTLADQYIASTDLFAPNRRALSPWQMALCRIGIHRGHKAAHYGLIQKFTAQSDLLSAIPIKRISGRVSGDD